MTLGKSTPPPTPWQSPPGFSVTMEDSGPPSLSPTPEESSTVFFCRMANLSLYLFPAPCPPPLPLPLRMLPQRWRPMWRLRRPLHPLDRFPRRFPPVPLSLVLASLRPPLPPLRSRTPSLTPTPPLLSAPLGAFGCALLCDRPTHTVLTPCAIVLFTAWQVLCSSPPPAIY